MLAATKVRGEVTKLGRQAWASGTDVTLGTGVQVMMRYSRYDTADVERWWRRRGTLRFTLFEYQRLLGYWTGLAD